MSAHRQVCSKFISIMISLFLDIGRVKTVGLEIILIGRNFAKAPLTIQLLTKDCTKHGVTKFQRNCESDSYVVSIR